MATAFETTITITDMDIFEDILSIMKDMYEVADEDTKAIIDIKLSTMNEKYSDRGKAVRLE